MLDGFVVPHSHFRVFQPERGAARRRSDLARALPPLAGAAHESASPQLPTDLHLREFAQLEAQVKAAKQQQQQQTSTAAALGVDAQALADASAGTLVECFAFYPRLMTVESFTWPDFLATVFTKLAEHFAHSSNDTVRSAIVTVFQQSAAHVAQVNDASKLVAHILAVLTTASTARTRTLALLVLETMPTLIQSDTAVHTELVTRLSAADADEQAAAVAATRAVLALALGPPTLQDAVVTRVLKPVDSSTASSTPTSSTALLALLKHAVRNARDADAAWNHCGVLYHDVADDSAAIACLRTMTALATQHTESLAASHAALLAHAVRYDSRCIVQLEALACARTLFASSASPSQLAPLMQRVVDVVCSDRVTDVRVRYAAILALECWCRDYTLHTNDDDTQQRVLAQAASLHRAQPERLGAAASTLLATVVHYELTECALQADAAAMLARTDHLRDAVASLLALLHPSAFKRSAAAWTSTLTGVERLCRTFPTALADHVVACLVELLALASDTASETTAALKRQLFQALARIAAKSADVVAQHSAVLQRELSALSSNSDRRAFAALAVALLRAHAPNDTTDAAAALARLLVDAPFATQHNRYELVKLAMTHGHYQLALELLTRVIGASASDSVGCWLHALTAMSDTEAAMQRDARVTLDSVYQLSRAATYLQAASTSRFCFAFQLHVVELRRAWMQRVLETQQFAGEAAFSNTSGAARERATRDGLVALAAQYRELRGALLGASNSVLDALEALAQVSMLLAFAIDAFLLLRKSLDAVPQLRTAVPLARRDNNDSDSDCAPAAMALWHACEALKGEISAKAALLQQIDASRRPALGAQVLQQLLRSVCALPLALPPQFFRLSVRAPRRLAANVQFLTHAESATFTSKPRPRSQLGVALGTDFNSLLKGVLEVAAGAVPFWRNRVAALEIDVRVQRVDKSTVSSAAALSEADSEDHSCICKRITLDWRLARGGLSGDADGSLFLAFETPVHVTSAHLRVKGSYQLLACVTAIDAHGDTWLLAPTGCSRGFIVY